MDIDAKFQRPRLFGTAATEIALEVPVYLYLMVMFTFLFSTYKLYCNLKEMFGLNQTEDTTAQDEESRSNTSIASTGCTGEATNSESQSENFLTKIGNTVSAIGDTATATENKALYALRMTFNEGKYLMVVSNIIDFFIASFVTIKLIVVMYGVA